MGHPEAVRRLASATVGHEGTVDDVKFGEVTFGVDHSDDAGTIKAGEKQFGFWIRELPDKTQVVSLAELTAIALNIAREANWPGLR